MKQIFFFIIISGSSILGNAQNFNYQFASTASNYQELSSGTALEEVASGNIYNISLGFNFNYLGNDFNTVAIDPGGYIYFNGLNNYALSIFSGIFPKTDSTNNSGIKYATIGADGNKIFKIQFASMGFGTSGPVSNFNFQVWLYEQNSKIEFHIGHNSIDNNEIKPIAGLMNKQQDSSPWAYLLGGDPVSANAQLMQDAGELPSLNTLPEEGTVYMFTPVED